MRKVFRLIQAPAQNNEDNYRFERHMDNVTAHLGKGAAKNVGRKTVDDSIPSKCTESGTVGMLKVVQSRYQIITPVELVFYLYFNLFSSILPQYHCRAV